MKPIKTIVAACLAAVALSVGALSLGACGPSAEEVVRQGVADELERLKTHDEALLDELAADSGVDQLATYGIDAKSFIAAYLDGFDYRIDEVKVDGLPARSSTRSPKRLRRLRRRWQKMGRRPSSMPTRSTRRSASWCSKRSARWNRLNPTRWNCRSRARTTHGGRRAEPSRRCLPRCSQVRVRVICGGYV